MKHINRLFLLLTIFAFILMLSGCTEETNDMAQGMALDIGNKVMDEVLKGAEEVQLKTQDELKKQLEKIDSQVNASTDEDYQKVVVQRVVDGDTIIVNIGDKEERVRFIGVNTPESVGDYKDNPQPYGKEASNFTKEQLEGKTVYLQSDVGDKDKYGRLLRYVWLSKPNKLLAKDKMFNAILVKEGYANTMSIPPNIFYQELFLELEKQARNEDKGLWGLE